MINAIKFAIEEIEASDQYFDHAVTADKVGFWPEPVCPLMTDSVEKVSVNWLWN